MMMTVIRIYKKKTENGESGEEKEYKRKNEYHNQEMRRRMYREKRKHGHSIHFLRISHQQKFSVTKQIIKAVIQNICRTITNIIIIGAKRRNNKINQVLKKTSLCLNCWQFAFLHFVYTATCRVFAPSDRRPPPSVLQNR